MWNTKIVDNMQQAFVSRTYSWITLDRFYLIFLGELESESPPTHRTQLANCASSMGEAILAVSEGLKTVGGTLPPHLITGGES